MFNSSYSLSGFHFRLNGSSASESSSSVKPSPGLVGYAPVAASLSAWTSLLWKDCTEGYDAFIVLDGVEEMFGF